MPGHDLPWLVDEVVPGDLKIRFDNQLSRMNCQTFSTGFNSGDRGGSARTVMLSGIASAGRQVQWAPGSTAALISQAHQGIISATRPIGV